MTAQNAPNADLHTRINLPGQARSDSGDGRNGVRTAPPRNDRDPLVSDADLAMLGAVHDCAPEAANADR